MTESEWAARLLRLLHDMMEGSRPSAVAVLQWAVENDDLVKVPRRSRARAGKRPELQWSDLRRIEPAQDACPHAGPLMDVAEQSARLLDLDPFERQLLLAAVAVMRMPRLSSLRRIVAGSTLDMFRFLGRAAGADDATAAQRVRRSDCLRFGLLEIDEGELGLDWQFGRLLDRGTSDDKAVTSALVGLQQQATLRREDFADHAEAFDFAARLIAGAVHQRLSGINLLLYGPPGTGKTEFARTLAHCANVRLFAAGETDEYGQEPSRTERLQALIRGQHLLSRHADTVLLLDEMEDLIKQEGFGRMARAGSKVFINRLLETNAVPIIWISNAICEIDPAHLRRMSFVLKMDYPSPSSRRRIVGAIAGQHGAWCESPMDGLAAEHPQVAAIAPVVLRAAAAAGGSSDEAQSAARSLLSAVNGDRPLAHAARDGALDLRFYESDPPVPVLIGQLRRADAPMDFSLLLTGPPGTGKTALARHIATVLDKPLALHRTSDLLSKWVGETEANIARAFRDARRNGSILLFDEVDSLLFDRMTARTSWEVTQVNELLTWMENHDLPFIAATNHVGRLDPAAMRRFDFKLRLEAMCDAKARLAFTHFFGGEPPASLARLRGLTTGDFAVVARQRRFRKDIDPGQLVDLLERELDCRPGGGRRIGF